MAATPVQSGRTRAAWHRRPSRATPDGYESGVANSHPTTCLLEHGVGPHEIRPEDAEALDTPRGPRAGLRHPGLLGTHMTDKAAADVELSLDSVAQPHLSRWASDIERRASTERG